MLPTLSPLTFEELRHLIEWPAELLYGDLNPIAANSGPDTDWHKLESQAHPIQSTAPIAGIHSRDPHPFDPPAAGIRETWELVDWTNRSTRQPGPGRPDPIPGALTATIARPTAAAYVRSQPQAFKLNPYKPQFDADYSDYAKQDGGGVLDGAAWVIGIASRTFFDAELFSRPTIELLTPSGAAQTLRGHAAREHSPDFIQRTMQDIYRQYEALKLGELRSLMLREINRWDDVARSAVIGPNDEIDKVISLVNAQTSAIVISKILEKLRHLNGFVVGVESALS